MRVLMGLMVALLMANDALAQDAGAVIIYRQQASHWNIVRVPANAREAMKQILKPGLVEMVDWSAFKSDPQRYLAPLVIKNEYPASDLPKLVVDLLETSGGPIAVAWTAGIGISNDDRDYAEKIYQLFRVNPVEYERTKVSGDQARDPLHPERPYARVLAGRRDLTGPWWKCQGSWPEEIPTRTEEERGRLMAFMGDRFLKNLSRADLIRRFGRPLKTQSRTVRETPDSDYEFPVVVTTWDFPGITITTAAKKSAPGVYWIEGGVVSDGRIDLGHGLAIGQSIERWASVLGRPSGCVENGRFKYEEMTLEIDGQGRVTRLEWSPLIP